MMPAIRRVITLTAAAMAMSLSQAAQSSSPGEWANTNLQDYLRGKSLSFSTLRLGDDIGLPALVTAGPLGENSCVTVAFKRSAFESGFLRELTDPGRPSNRQDLVPFTSPGVEVVLRGDDVLLKLHSGTIVHLRDDYSYARGLRAFKSGPHRGRVIWATGTVVISKDLAKVGQELKEFAILPVSAPIEIAADKMKKERDGSYTGTVQIDSSQIHLPPRFPPRISQKGDQESQCSVP